MSLLEYWQYITNTSVWKWTRIVWIVVRDVANAVGQSCQAQSYSIVSQDPSHAGRVGQMGLGTERRRTERLRTRRLSMSQHSLQHLKK